MSVLSSVFLCVLSDLSRSRVILYESHFYVISGFIQTTRVPLFILFLSWVHLWSHSDTFTLLL